MKEIIVLIIAMSPFVELRGAIPVALSLGMAPVDAFFYSFIGNLVPAIFLLLFLEPVAIKLSRYRFFSSILSSLFARTRKKKDVIEKYGCFGLIPFVAIPLPFTGAWTGCLVAWVFGMRFRYAFPAIFLGVLIAGFIVMGASLGIIKLWG